MKNTSDLPYPFNVQRDVLGDLSDAIDNPDELCCAVEYALTLIPERERQAVHYRYRDNMKFTEIAKELGCSSARCRQIVDKALRRLRCRPAIIQNGKNSNVISIYDLGISLRTINALRRCNILSVEDLAATTVQQLRKVRNIGPKTTDEIVETLRAKGIELKESEIEA